ncbi:MAG: glycosyl hydrolase [Cytophagales bacterium]|nr:glycosyl hydrolase [Cytophagales bacterium]
MRLLYILFFLITTNQEYLYSQKKNKGIENHLESISINALKWRSVGPALTSGRVSDIAVNKNNPFEYYVAVASGGVWKTSNWGLEYIPVFDNESSYSIASVTIDPNNSNTVWVGTGENNNQRSVPYGDGVYKSTDAGKSWKNVGLKTSEHIGNIVVDPNDSEVVYVSAYGPLWSSGGERGVYKTVDGGKNWKRILYIDEHTGINEVHMDPKDSRVLYATAHQRRRHVYTYVGGGPGSSIYKSTDSGTSWKKINKGLPSVEIGRIGMDISPVDNNVIYAIVEAADRKGGFYKSDDMGESWTKQSNKVTSGNYYQEIFADPIDLETVYIMDTWMSVTKDGGKTFKNVGEDFKHVDNHAMWINPKNNQHWLVGCDGGIYETFDAAKNWDFKKNLPVTQFYKVAVDNDVPFYNIYGGTQDNFSIGGPSRVNTSHGITNQDWFITHGGDGFESQVDPENPDIVYAQSQYGWLVRYDKRSGEEVGIKPISRKGELGYKWNWDAPLAVSSHKSGRLYFAANKVFRSDDYGNNWDVISDDLSRKIDRNKLKVYDRVLSMDAVAKNGSTSLYGTIVALSESTLDEDLIVIGTDDGLVQITTNGGESWRKVDNIPGAPSQSYVNAVYTSQHDENVIYAVFNHHKHGDFRPYVFMTRDKGYNWTSISSNLPSRGSVYSIEEDHLDPGLIFCGTEFGAFFSPNNGGNWKELSKGLPTIAVRDIAIQRQMNDLVLGTFGRGFYVLDDYSLLRDIENKEVTQKAMILPTRDAIMWEKSSPLGLPGKAFQGDNFYTADNLDPVAMISYYYDENYKSIRDKRREKEKKLIKDKEDVYYPEYDALKAEMDEDEAKLLFTVKNSEGLVVKKVLNKPSKGFDRFHWDLRYEVTNPINLSSSSFYNPFAGVSEGTLVEPGTYTVQMDYFVDGESTTLVEPKEFTVSLLDNTVLPAEDREAKVRFQRDVSMLQGEISSYSRILSEIGDKVNYFEVAILRLEKPILELSSDMKEVKDDLRDINTLFYGDNVKRRLDMQEVPTPSSRVGIIANEQKYSTAAPTGTHINSLKIAKEEFVPIKSKVNLLVEKVKSLEDKMKALGASYTPGRYDN